MCGISGIIGGRQRRPVLKRMMDALVHRGPDDDGSLTSPSRAATFGFRRLSIIDLEGGSQPMTSEDGKIMLVFNGEIYNFRELRERLKRQGHRFRSDCDAEVVVHLYEEEGRDALEQLEGMFAFAIWDDHERALLLARDRAGKKPLSYWTDGEQFVFASEIKALLAHPSVPREMNPAMLPYYLTYLYVPAPHTMFRDIHKVPPGHWLWFQDGEVETGRYWEPGLEPEDLTLEEAAEKIYHTVSEAVKRRLVSDVPLGAFLSGGLDSSIVVGMMTQHMNEPVKTFSIGFEEEKYDELKYARAAADHFQTDHREFTVKADAVEVLPRLVWHYDEPFADSSAVPTYYVSQKTSEHVKVALSGDGGDETFGGYMRYGIIDRLTKARILPTFGSFLSTVMGVLPAGRNVRRVRRLLKMLDRPPSELYLELVSFYPVGEHSRILQNGGLSAPATGHILGPFESRTEDPVTAAQYTDLMTYLPGDILTKVDIASMANSLEVRCPLLDREVVELAFRLPSDLRVRRNELKIALRRAFRGLLPPMIRDRGKMGFGVPVREWFRGPLSPLIDEYVLRDRGWFHMEEVRRMVTEHRDGRSDYGHHLWILLCLELWYRTFIETSTPQRVTL